MKTSKCKNRDLNLKDWLSERLTGVSLSCRFLILFAAACLLGICIENNAYYSVDHIVNGYFASFYCNDLLEFIKSVCLSSSFEFFVLLVATGSALTFFCSAFLHFLCITCGSIYGICVGALTNANIQNKNIFVLLYIFSVVAFAVIYSISASFVLNANKQFISAKRSNASFSKFFVSPIFKKYFVGCLKAIIAFIIMRILYVSALSIAHII